MLFMAHALFSCLGLRQDGAAGADKSLTQALRAVKK
jgi:hypothetical protein